MRTFLKVYGLSFLCLLATTSLVSAQAFVNLDFEDAVIVPGGPKNMFVNAEQALPGWTVRTGSHVIDYTGYNGATPITVFSEPLLMGPEVIGSGGPPWLPIIQGEYTFYMVTYLPYEDYNGVSISQTGLVPADALSIRLLALTSDLNAPYSVSLGGLEIPMTAVSTSGDITELAGDISVFAGSIGELTITCSLIEDEYHQFGFDAITFSPEVVPEPATMLLLAFGGSAFLCWRRFPVTRS